MARPNPIHNFHLIVSDIDMAMCREWNDYIESDREELSRLELDMFKL